MFIPYNSFTVFGSGYGYASLKINGIKITNKMIEKEGWKTSSDHNGFIGYEYVNVPIDVLKDAILIEYECDAYPGGASELKCSGSKFIKRYLNCRKSNILKVFKDRYCSLISSLQSKRYFEWVWLRDEWAISLGIARRIEDTVEYRETFRLPDGAKGGRWTRFVPDGLNCPIEMP